jgi:hypothetical protein
MTMRKTGQTSKVLEMQSFYKVWVTSVFAKKRFFMSFSTLIVKHHRGFRPAFAEAASRRQV